MGHWPSQQIYAVKLSREQRGFLEQFIKSKEASPHSKLRAKMLLCLDENGANPLTVDQTAKVCHSNRQGLYKIRKMVAAAGVDRALYRKLRRAATIAARQRIIKHTVRLSREQREFLEESVNPESSNLTRQAKVRAKVLLCLDESAGDPLTLKQASEKCSLHENHIFKIRKRFTAEGMEGALYRKKRKDRAC
jgi:YesN/AraC family two-component response regulator